MKDGSASEYVLYLRSDGCEHTVNFPENPGKNQIHEECEDWIQDGDYGDEGASVEVGWQLEEDGAEIDAGYLAVDIEPNEEALIRVAGGDVDCQHDWTAEGEGGCAENPGVWSAGGTSMVFKTHCRTCGLQRTDRRTGSQRNPGEHDTVNFFQPRPR